MPSASYRSAASPAAPETPVERLQTAVDELSQNVRVLTDLVDQVREDLSWLTRNRMPHQPLHVLVRRMPLDPQSAREGSLEISILSLPPRDPTTILSGEEQRSAVIEEVVQRLAEPLGGLAQEQLNLLLSVMDHAHREVMQAIRGTRPITDAAGQPKKRRRPRSTPAPIAPASAEPPPPPGHLF